MVDDSEGEVLVSHEVLEPHALEGIESSSCHVERLHSGGKENISSTQKAERTQAKCGT